MENLYSIISSPVVAVVLLLGILIFVHEAGHFLVGKICGISVEIFSIGFGPVLFGFTRNSTKYRLSIIPLGGFVKFHGASHDEDLPENLNGMPFREASLRARTLTIIAGPLANFLLAIVCYFSLGLAGIEHLPARVGLILNNSPAEKAGLTNGDVVEKIDDVTISNWTELHEIITKSPGKTLSFSVLREGQRQSIDIAVERNQDSGEEYGRIGISPGIVPPIVTIASSDTLAAKQGLETGDKVLSVKFGNDLTSMKTIKISDWSGLQQNVILARQNKFETLMLEVFSPAKTTRWLEIPITSDSSLQDFGILESQLTIKTIKNESLKNDILKGDILLAFEQKPISTIFDLSKALTANKKPTVAMEIMRNGQKMILNEVKLEPVDIQKAEGKETVFTLSADFYGELTNPEPIIERYGFMGAINYGFQETWNKTVLISQALFKLITGNMPLKALGGPISIAKIASDSAKMGWMTFISAMALISINLGLLNLVPIPLLDGGQLLLLSFEGALRKPLPPAIIENFQKIGFVMVLGLMIMATYNDFSRFWTSMLEGFVGFFNG